MVVREKTLKAAANMMEVDVTDIELHDGAAWVKGSNRFVPLAAVATATNPLRYAFNEAAQAATQFAPASRHDGPPLAEGQAPGLEGTDYYSPPHATWAYGVHGALVEVDPDLCTVKIQKYVCIHDCGNMINPMIVEGQVHGGMPRGSAARSTSGSNTNPAATSPCEFRGFSRTLRDRNPEHRGVASGNAVPLNPLGVKGVGEAGCIAVGAVVASAVEEALKPLGAGKFHHVPLTPSIIQAALDRAGA